MSTMILIPLVGVVPDVTKERRTGKFRFPTSTTDDNDRDPTKWQGTTEENWNKCSKFVHFIMRRTHPTQRTTQTITSHPGSTTTTHFTLTPASGGVNLWCLYLPSSGDRVRPPQRRPNVSYNLPSGPRPLCVWVRSVPPPTTVHYRPGDVT